MESEEDKDTSPADGGGVRLGRIAGVEFRADWGLLLAFVLIALTFGAAVFPERHLGWDLLRVWLVAIVAAALFVIAILVHELGHAIVAQRLGCHPWRVRLFILCGATELRESPRSPGIEVGIMLAGLLSSLVLGWLSAYLGTVLAGERLHRQENPIETLRGLRTLEALLLWFGPVNLLVGLLNLLPSYPLDGGRLLWAIVWRITGDRRHAAKLAAQTGRAVGVVIMLVGIAMILGLLRVRYVGGGFIVGLWTLFIGLFLHRAAAIGYLGPSD